MAQTWFIKLTGGNLVQRLFGGLQCQRRESQHIVQQRLQGVVPFMRVVPAFKQPQRLQAGLVKHTRGFNNDYPTVFKFCCWRSCWVGNFD